jgi:hypothetical protein
MSVLNIPGGYKSTLSLYETQVAIGEVQVSVWDKKTLSGW